MASRMYLRPPRTPVGPVRALHVHPELRGEDDLVSPRSQGLAQVFLREALAVDVGGVEEGHAGVEGGVDDRAGLVSIEARAEVVAPEPDHRDRETGSAQPHPSLGPRCGVCFGWITQGAEGIASAQFHRALSAQFHRALSAQTLASERFQRNYTERFQRSGMKSAGQVSCLTSSPERLV